MIYFIFIAIAVISYIVQSQLNGKFQKYSQVPLPSGMTGADVAQMMLSQNGIQAVGVTQIPGKLTDHFNPASMTVNLSPEVYGGCSVAAAAVAAHECGHAVQHKVGYPFLRMRSSMVPVVSFSSKITPWLLLLGIFTIQTFPALLFAGIILFALSTLFSFITLPVEIDASRRALAWLDQTGITDPRTHAQARDALKSAAYTYVVAAVSSLATLLYYVMIFSGGRRR